MTWVNPNGRAFAFLPAAEKAPNMPQKEEALPNANEKKTHVLSAQPKQEILPPDSKVSHLALPDAHAVPRLDLAEFERQIRNSAKMLDLSVPEGFLDRLIGRPDHRIDVKTERGQRLARYISACGAKPPAARQVPEARRQSHLDHLTFLMRVAEEQQKLEAVTARFQLQMQIEEAKAREIISEHEAKIRE